MASRKERKIEKREKKLAKEEERKKLEKEAKKPKREPRKAVEMPSGRIIKSCKSTPKIKLTFQNGKFTRK